MPHGSTKLTFPKMTQWHKKKLLNWVTCWTNRGSANYLKSTNVITFIPFWREPNNRKLAQILDHFLSSANQRRHNHAISDCLVPYLYDVRHYVGNGNWSNSRGDRGHSYGHYNDVIMGAMASRITSLTIVYSAVYSGSYQRKHRSSAPLAFVHGIHRDRWIPRTNGQ